MAITLSEYAAMGKLLTDRDRLLPSHRLPHLMSSSLHSTHTQDKSINFLKFHFLSSRYVHIKKAGEHFEGVKWRNLLSFSHHRRKAKIWSLRVEAVFRTQAIVLLVEFIESTIEGEWSDLQRLNYILLWLSWKKLSSSPLFSF